jgi:multidrug efflux pump subunit AcrA (membrane-fusion protein)
MVEAGQPIAVLLAVEDTSMQAIDEYQTAMDNLQAARMQLSKAENELSGRQADLLSIQALLTQSKASVVSARNAAEQARSDLEIAIRDIQQKDKLVQQVQRLYDEGALSRNDLQQAQAAQTRAITRRDQAQNALKNAQAEIGLLSDRVKAETRAIGRTNIGVRQVQKTVSLMRGTVNKHQIAVYQMQNQLQSAQREQQQFLLQSPVSGIVVGVSTRSGALVTPAMEVVRIRPVGVSTVQCQATDADAAKLKTGMATAVRHSKVANSLIGMITAIPLTDNGGNHRNLIVMAVRDPNNVLRLGSRVTAHIPLSRIKGVAVPQSAVIRSNGRLMVWTVSNRKAHGCPVTVVGTQDDTAIISRGLKVDDLVIVSSARSLKEGVQVSTINK